MPFGDFSRFRFRTPIILPIVAALLVSYFAFYTFFGERSLLKLMQLEKQTQAAKAELDSVRAEKEAVQAKVNRMRPSSIDPDLLDQQARHVLNYTAPDEIVIMTPATGTVPEKSIASPTPTGTKPQ